MASDDRPAVERTEEEKGEKAGEAAGVKDMLRVEVEVRVGDERKEETGRI